MNKAVLFDMNGVIVDDEPLHLAAFRSVLRGKGHELTDQQYKQHFAGKTDRDGFLSHGEAVGQTYDLDAVMQAKTRAYIEMAQGALRPYEGVIEFVKALARQSIPLALVTSSFKVEADAVLQAFGIVECFSVVVTAGDIQRGKPDPQGYLMGAQLLGAEPAVCTVIEDAPSGIAAAKAAGMHCIAVANTHTRHELRDADILVERLDSASVELLA